MTDLDDPAIARGNRAKRDRARDEHFAAARGSRLAFGAP
jgi:hypothetical protein